MRLSLNLDLFSPLTVPNFACCPFPFFFLVPFTLATFCVACCVWLPRKVECKLQAKPRNGPWSVIGIVDHFDTFDDNFANSIREIYPSELELKDTTLSSTEVCYLDTKIVHGDSSAPFHISVHDKRENFDFPIVNFPSMDGNIPATPAYVVYIPQIVRYARICTALADLMHSVAYPPVLNNKASNLRYSSNRLKNSSNIIVQQWLDIMLHYENYDPQFLIEKYGSSRRCILCLLVISNVFIFLVCNIAGCQKTHCFWIQSLDTDVCARFSWSDWCACILLI